MRTLQSALLLLLVCFLLISSPAPVQGQDRNIAVRPSLGPRLALVIGNSAYRVGRLRNPVNDARAMVRTLDSLGFDVMHVEDGSLREMEQAVRNFGRRLREGGTGLFYYAGHGIQAEGNNYLIPVDAEVEGQEELRYESMNVGFVLAQMEEANNGLNIVILDACRNNPFARSWRSADEGLAQVSAPTGTLIAYATAPGSVASDGDGENGLYTQQLLRFMEYPGLPVEDVFKQIRIAVMAQTGGSQVPWESSSLIGDFYFVTADEQVADTQSEEIGPLSTAIAVTAGGAGHSCALNHLGEAYCWGRGQEGQLGNGSTADSRIPVRVMGNRRWTAIDVGTENSCGLTEEGDLYCWGDGQNGHLGNGILRPGNDNVSRAIPSPYPSRVVGGMRWVQFDVSFRSCGVTADGEGYCWGSNYLGHGERGPSATPVKVVGGPWASISSSTRHACGIASDGKAYCWGPNNHGQLGNGEDVSLLSTSEGLGAALTPQMVAGNLRWSQIAVGNWHTCGIAPDGRAYCWGDNVNGQLGNGELGGRALTPVMVAGGLRWLDIDAAYGTTCGITVDREAYCWGEWSDQGECCNAEDAVTWLTPSQIPGVSIWSSVNLGINHACGLTVEGHVYCWGYDRVTDLSLEPRRITIHGVQAGDPP